MSASVPSITGMFAARQGANEVVGLRLTIVLPADGARAHRRLSPREVRELILAHRLGLKDVA